LVYGEYLATKLKARWPFTKGDPPTDPVRAKFTPETVPEKLAFERYAQRLDWLQTTQALYQFRIQQKEYRNAERIAEVMAIDNPYSPTPYDMAGFAAVQAEDFESAHFWYEKALRLDKSEATAKKLSLSLVALDRFDDAIGILEKYRGSAEAGQMLDGISKMSQASQALKQGSNDVQVMLLLAQSYAGLSMRTKAEALVKRVLEIDPENAVAKSFYAAP
jgi:tetratricopeptide (TPR) repeat protein